MSSVLPVPETELMGGELLSADDAWHTLRRYHFGHLVTTAFVRFRYGDGFSHARAFAFQLALAAVPLIIAGAGLATSLGAESFAEVVARTVVAISPGSSDALVQQAVAGGDGDEGTERAEVVVVLGLVTAFLAATSAFAQLERGANRIYGTERDRPTLRKYGRAAVLTATAGVSMTLGLLLIVAGEPFGEAIEQVYRWGDAAETGWDILRWPFGLAALVVAVTALFRYSPRRKQPELSWLAVGAGATVLAWLAGSGLLAVYVVIAENFGETYGPLAAVIVLLLWANITGIALLAGMAMAAQLEAVRADRPEPLLADTDEDGIPDVHDEHPGSTAR